MSSPLKLGLAHGNYARQPFGISAAGRLHHLYLLGQTGTGKSTLLAQMARQDIENGQGFFLLDPHGDLARGLKASCPPSAIYWEVANPSHLYGYNPLQHIAPPYRPLLASHLIYTLKQQWSDAWGVRMEHLLRYTVLALLEKKDSTLADIIPWLLDQEYRERYLLHIQNQAVRHFWQVEYKALGFKTAVDGVASIANKIDSVLAHPVLQKALCQPAEPLRFRQFMDKGKIVIVSLDKGRLGSDMANIMGGFLVSALLQAAFSRGTMAERPAYFLYVDEFHSFTTEAMADMLSETRKYGLGVVLAQQHMEQNSQAVTASILGNIATKIIFRASARDALALAEDMGGVDPHMMIGQPNYQALVRMLIAGVPSPAFTVYTLPQVAGGLQCNDKR